MSQNESPAQTDLVNVISLPDAGRVLEVLGTTQLWRIESEQTGGRMVCVEITVPPGHGIPPHWHRYEDEMFYVLSGRIVIQGDDCEGRSVILDRGGFFYGARGRIHSFRCEGTETGKLLVIVTPGAPTAALFAEIDGLARQRGSALDAAGIAEVCGRYGITFVPQ